MRKVEQVSDGLEPVEPRHTDVEKDHIRLELSPARATASSPSTASPHTVTSGLESMIQVSPRRAISLSSASRTRMVMTLLVGGE